MKDTNEKTGSWPGAGRDLFAYRIREETMATIEDYVTGRVCTQPKKAFAVFDAADGALSETDIGRIMLDNVDRLAPRKLTRAQAIANLNTCRKHPIIAHPGFPGCMQKSVPPGPPNAFTGTWRSTD